MIESTIPGDLVYNPFAGIGSVGVVAIEKGRRFLGSELKRSYWTQAVANLRAAVPQPEPTTLPYEGEDGAPTVIDLLKAWRAQQDAARSEGEQLSTA